jgi:hypothetical protein
MHVGVTVWKPSIPRASLAGLAVSYVFDRTHSNSAFQRFICALPKSTAAIAWVLFTGWLVRPQVFIMIPLSLKSEVATLAALKSGGFEAG